MYEEVQEEEGSSSSDDNGSFTSADPEIKLTVHSNDSVDSGPRMGIMSTRAIFSQFDDDALSRLSSTGSIFLNISERVRGLSGVSVSAHIEEESSSSSSDSTYFVPESRDVISELEAMAIITVLEDAVDQLHILGLANPENSTQPEIIYKSLEEKFKAQTAKAAIIDQDTDKPIKDSMETSLLVKVQRDRAFAEKTLSQTLSELKQNRTFSALQYMVAQESYSKEEEENLLKEERKNTGIVTNLRDQLESEDVETASRLQEKAEILAKLKDDYQDGFFAGKMKVKFVKLWEKAREEQNLHKHKKEESAYEKELALSTYGADVEQRVHSEIENYIYQQHAKFEEDIETWMERYDQEIEQRETDINFLRRERQSHYKQFEELALVYQHHKNEIHEYLEKKAIKEEKRLRELYLYNMATRIQAWWRGMMVRHHLGPYRKKKGKGKDKKGKDKKGKRK